MWKFTAKENSGSSPTRFGSREKKIEDRRKKLDPEKRFFYLLISILYFLSSGCAVYRSSSPIPANPALPAEYQHYYDYPKVESFEPKILLEKKERSYHIKRLELPLNLPEKLRAEDLKTLQIEYYVPNDLKPGEKRPSILISPILGGNMVVDRFAAYYAGRGYIAAIVHRKKLEWNDQKEIDQVEDYLKTCVIRIRQALDWLETQPEVDQKRIGAFGVSYGGILHTVLAAIEPRIKYHVVAMPGGPLADVIMKCPEKQITKLVKNIRKKYNWKDEKILEELRKAIKTDPILLAPYVQKSKVQMYVAWFDRVVWRKHSMNLWRALGKPELKIIPFGHYGGVVVFPLLQTQSYLAFRKHLKQRA